MRKPLISVCMIVKNEETNLRRCLDSLRPLVERVPTEIIIVDTGSTDSTPEIAKQFTDKVYFHEWNNSFSDMRNESISYGRGEWILIIDADEELENYQGIIQVLQLKNINQFNSIRFKIRNLLFKHKKQEAFNSSERMFRNDGTFKYVGSIHNQPAYKFPVINTDITLSHYGYFNDDPELMERKFQRTSKMLIQELEKDPTNIYYQFQLAKSYSMHKELRRALVEVRKSYELVHPLSEIEKKNQYYYVYGEYVRILFLNEAFEDCIQLAEEAMLLTPQYIDLYYYKGASHASLKQIEYAVAAFKKYFELYDDFLNNKLNLSQYASAEMYTIDERAVHASALHLVDYLSSADNNEEALFYTKFLPVGQEKSTRLIQICMKLSKFQDIFDYYAILKDQGLVAHFQACLEDQLQSVTEEDRKRIAFVFSNGEDLYAKLCQIRLTEDRISLINCLLSEMDVNEFQLQPFSQAFVYALENGISITPFLKKASDVRIKLIVASIVENSKQAADELARFVVNSKVRANDLHGNRILAAVGHALLLIAVKEKKTTNLNFNQQVYLVIESFTRHAKQYIASLYQTNGIRLIYKTLDNKEHQFYILLFLASEAKLKGYPKQAIDYYKEAAEGYPYFSELIKIIIKDLVIEEAMQEVITSMERDVPKDTGGLKVLQGTIEIANQMSLLNRGLNQAGVFARSLTYYPNYLKYHADYVLDIQEYQNKVSMVQHQEQLRKQAMDCFNMYHFHFGSTLYNDHSDLPLLKEAGKGMLMHYWGSDVRMLSVARQRNPFIQVKNVDEDAIKRKLELLATYIDHCVVADHELYQYVKGYHQHTYFIKQSMDLESYKPAESFSFRKKKPVVVHAPTSPEIKGTAYIMQAVEQLSQDYDFEFVLVQGKSHEEAKAIYQQADLVLDELLIGSYGILAMEAMSMGKPVITYINEHIRETYPADLPIVSANPNTVKDVLLKLLKDWELRQELGKQGRAYVQKYHDVNVIASQFADLYRKIIPLRETTVHAY